MKMLVGEIRERNMKRCDQKSKNEKKMSGMTGGCVCISVTYCRNSFWNGWHDTRFNRVSPSLRMKTILPFYPFPPSLTHKTRLFKAQFDPEAFTDFVSSSGRKKREKKRKILTRGRESWRLLATHTHTL